MRRKWLFVVVLAMAVVAAEAATPVWVTPDVPTDEGLGGTTLLQDTIYRYDGVSYTPVFTVPGGVDINAIHKMDTFGDWLFSIEAPSDLGGALAGVAEPRDLILWDASAGTFSICMSGAAAGIPASSNIDAVYMDPGDDGDIIVSFDVPTDIPPFVGPTAFEPADLVRLAPAAIATCANPYTVVAANPELDASLIAPNPVPISTNVDGAEDPHMRWTLAFDVPTDLPPFVGPTAFVPGILAEWDAIGGVWSVFETLGGWPISGIVDGVSCGGSAGRVPDTSLMVNKSGIANIVVTWAPSCLPDGGQDYAVYEGTIGAWYSHIPVVCNDALSDLSETFAPGAGNQYYLVVPQNDCKGSEGSYGRCSTGFCGLADERPQLAGACGVGLQRLPFPGDPSCP